MRSKLFLTIGIELAIIAVSAWLGYRLGLVVPELSYTVATARPVVFDNAFSPAISLSRENVWALTVFVWNRGRLPIVPPFDRAPRLRMHPPSRILSATIVRATDPDICGFRIDDRHRASGILDLAWRKLEHNDGAAVEIVYVGARMSEVSIDGAWTGQRELIHRGFARRTNFMIGLLAYLILTSLFLCWAAMVSNRNIVLRIVTFVMLAAMTWIAVHLVLFGIPRAIDVGVELVYSGFTAHPPYAVIPAIPPKPIVSPALEGTMTMEPFSLIAS